MATDAGRSATPREDHGMDDNAASGWTQDQSLWPAHLRDDAPFATCSACGRHTWDVTGFGYECRLPQPNGKPCTGTLVAPAGSAE